MKTLFETLSKTGLFKPEAIKVRVKPYESFIEPTCERFLHSTIQILSGRSNQTKKKLSADVIKSLSEHLSDLKNLLITVQIVDIHSECYQKRQISPKL